MIRLIRKKGITVLTVLFISLLFTSLANGQGDTGKKRVYMKIEIKGMACPYCAYGMEKELKRISGVNSVEIKLKKGLAYISTPAEQKPTKESLEKIIIDAGFTPGKVEFRNKPFKIEEEKKK